MAKRKRRCRYGKLARPVRTARGGLRRCKLPPRRRRRRVDDLAACRALYRKYGR